MNLNKWLAYSIAPGELDITLRPAIYGNGRLQVSPDIHRTCIHEAVCFGFADEGFYYGPYSSRFGGEQHLMPALYDAETGRKYFLYLPESPGEYDFKVTFRPDRQVWQYDYDDLAVHVSMIAPRLQPGYLLKLELFPKAGNACRRWFVYHELRDHQGITMRATEPGQDLAGARAWLKTSRCDYAECLGSTVDAEHIDLGLDGPWATSVMIKTVVESDRDDGGATAYYARGFGDTTGVARESVDALLAAPGKLETENEAWWNRHLGEVPRLDVPDEAIARKFLWLWANFRMNRMDIPIGNTPAGTHRDNYGTSGYKFKPMCVLGNLLVEASQVLYDPGPARDAILYWLRETTKTGVLRSGIIRGEEAPGNYVCVLIWMCGLLYRYMLLTGDFDLMHEDIGGMTVLERLEEATDAQLPFRDNKTGLFPIEDEITRYNDRILKEYGIEPGDRPLGPGNSSESQTRFRGGAGTFYCDMDAEIYASFLVMANLEALAGNEEKRGRYRQLAEEMYDRIQRYHWNEEKGFFCDLRSDGTVSDYIGGAGFIAGLFMNPAHRQGGVATREQAERLAAWCNHPDFVSDLGVMGLARSSPYYDPRNWKGRNGGLNFYPTNQFPAGLYAHGCVEEAHRQLFKLFKRVGDNAGLGPRFNGEAYDGYTGEILPWRNANYAFGLTAVTGISEGAFGLRFTDEALEVHVQSAWPRAKLSNLRIRGRMLALELTEEGTLIASVAGNEIARSDDRRFRLPWEMFETTTNPH